jgi:hypothetical protein
LRGRVNLRNVGTLFWKRFSAASAQFRCEIWQGAWVSNCRTTWLLNCCASRANASTCTVVFLGIDPGSAMLSEQGGRIVRKLARHEQLRISIVPGADHTFTAHWTRDQLVELLMAHLERHAARP